MRSTSKNVPRQPVLGPLVWKGLRMTWKGLCWLKAEFDKKESRVAEVITVIVVILVMLILFRGVIR